MHSVVPIDSDKIKHRHLGPVDAAAEPAGDGVLGDDAASDSDDDLNAAIVEPPADKESATSLWRAALLNGQMLGGITEKDFEVSGGALPTPSDPLFEGMVQSPEEYTKALLETISPLQKLGQ